MLANPPVCNEDVLKCQKMNLLKSTLTKAVSQAPPLLSQDVPLDLSNMKLLNKQLASEDIMNFLRSHAGENLTKTVTQSIQRFVNSIGNNDQPVNMLPVESKSNGSKPIICATENNQSNNGSSNQSSGSSYTTSNETETSPNMLSLQSQIINNLDKVSSNVTLGPNKPQKKPQVTDAKSVATDMLFVSVTSANQFPPAEVLSNNEYNKYTNTQLIAGNHFGHPVVNPHQFKVTPSVQGGTNQSACPQQMMSPTNPGGRVMIGNQMFQVQSSQSASTQPTKNVQGVAGVSTQSVQAQSLLILQANSLHTSGMLPTTTTQPTQVHNNMQVDSSQIIQPVIAISIPVSSIGLQQATLNSIATTSSQVLGNVLTQGLVSTTPGLIQTSIPLVNTVAGSRMKTSVSPIQPSSQEVPVGRVNLNQMHTTQETTITLPNDNKLVKNITQQVMLIAQNMLSAQKLVPISQSVSSNATNESLSKVKSNMKGVKSTKRQSSKVVKMDIKTEKTDTIQTSTENNPYFDVRPQSFSELLNVVNFQINNESFNDSDIKSQPIDNSQIKNEPNDNSLIKNEPNDNSLIKNEPNDDGQIEIELSQSPDIPVGEPLDILMYPNTDSSALFSPASSIDSMQRTTMDKTSVSSSATESDAGIPGLVSNSMILIHIIHI
jgi:hypothetical protein